MRRNGLALDRVGLAVGEYVFGREVDTHEIGFEIHVLIGHIALVIDVYQTVARIEDERVGILALDDVFKEGTAGALRRVGRQSVASAGASASGERLVQTLRGKRIGTLPRFGTTPVAAGVGRPFARHGRPHVGQHTCLSRRIGHIGRLAPCRRRARRAQKRQNRHGQQRRTQYIFQVKQSQNPIFFVPLPTSRQNRREHAAAAVPGTFLQLANIV